jgi:predicted transcriptional regulator
MITGSFKKHLDESMKDPAFRKAWHDLDPEFELLESIIKTREKAGITQAQLAKKVGTRQSAISRLETGGFKNATVETLKKIADALDAKLVVKLQPKRG